MATAEDTRLAKLALERKWITPKQLQKALVEQKNRLQGQEQVIPLASILEEQGFLSKKEVKTLQQETEKNPKTAEKLPGYRLIRKIGEGGMGVVYEGFDTQQKRRVAIKVLPSKFAKDNESRMRFLREAEATQRLRHPNIIEGYEVLEQNKKFFFVMEYMEGSSVEAEILNKNAPYSEEKSLWIVRQLADALSYCHQNHILHRDIKPENILVNDSLQLVKLTDLGLVKDLSQDSNITQAGMTVGTPNYISPEQAKGNSDLDARCDIYSLGATLYFMLTARVPFDGNSPLAVMTKHIHEPLIPPKNYVPTLSDGTNALVVKMMAKLPKMRYGSCDEVIRDIQRIQNGEPLSEISVKKFVQKAPSTRASSARNSGLRSGLRKAQQDRQKKLKQTFTVLALGCILFGVLGLFLFLPSLLSSSKQAKEAEKEAFMLIQSQILSETNTPEKHLQSLQHFSKTYPQSPYQKEIETYLEKLQQQHQQLQILEKILSTAEQYLQERKFDDALQLLEKSRSQFVQHHLNPKFEQVFTEILKQGGSYFLQEIRQLAEIDRAKALQRLFSIKPYFVQTVFEEPIRHLEKEIQTPLVPEESVSLLSPTYRNAWQPIWQESERNSLQSTALSQGIHTTFKGRSAKAYGGYLIQLSLASEMELNFDMILDHGDIGIMFNSVQYPSLHKSCQLPLGQKVEVRFLFKNQKVLLFLNGVLVGGERTTQVRQSNFMFLLEGQDSAARLYRFYLKSK